MKDALEVCTRPYDPRYPQVCVDEVPTPLLRDTHTPLPTKPEESSGETRRVARLTSASVRRMHASSSSGSILHFRRSGLLLAQIIHEAENIPQHYVPDALGPEIGPRSYEGESPTP